MLGFDGGKLSEEERHSKFAVVEPELLKEGRPEVSVENVPKAYLPPFLDYYSCVNDLINSDHVVLELGIGTGRHTKPLLQSGAKIIGIDIDESALKVCRIRGFDIELIQCSMESIALPDSSIDIVVSCASLSYGEAEIVNSEIFRILKLNGTLILLDTLNENPVYRINRFLDFLLGRRTKKTLKNMPDLSRLDSLTKMFKSSQTNFYGSYLWLYKLMCVFRLPKFGTACNSFFEERFPSKKNAFKFVFVGKGLVSHVEVRDSRVRDTQKS